MVKYVHDGHEFDVIDQGEEGVEVIREGYKAWIKVDPMACQEVPYLVTYSISASNMHCTTWDIALSFACIQLNKAFRTPLSGEDVRRFDLALREGVESLRMFRRELGVENE